MTTGTGPGVSIGGIGSPACSFSEEEAPSSFMCMTVSFTKRQHIHVHQDRRCWGMWNREPSTPLWHG